MGGGAWTTKSFVNYSKTKGYNMSNSGVVLDNLSVQDTFKARTINPNLDPKNVMRECVDSDEHPNTIPVIIGLDVTGSMGAAGVEVAKQLNTIITDLYSKYKDIEIMVMGIGDLAYDRAPIQISQFESDIRIAEQLDNIYFERGGGGNGFESYSVAWYMGLYHTKLDCWKRGKKGIIITTGDEPLNPYLPMKHAWSDSFGLINATGDSLEADVETSELYKNASEKFDIYHIAVDDQSTSFFRYKDRIISSFTNVLPDNHLKISTLDALSSTIVACIDDALNKDTNTVNTFTGVNVTSEGIAW